MLSVLSTGLSTSMGFAPSSWPIEILEPSLVPTFENSWILCRAQTFEDEKIKLWACPCSVSQWWSLTMAAASALSKATLAKGKSHREGSLHEPKAKEALTKWILTPPAAAATDWDLHIFVTAQSCVEYFFHLFQMLVSERSSGWEEPVSRRRSLLSCGQAASGCEVSLSGNHTPPHPLSYRNLGGEAALHLNWSCGYSIASPLPGSL